MKTRRLSVILLALILALSVLPAQAAETLAAAPLVEQSGNTDGMIRVWLKSISTNVKYDITVQGDYTINGNTAQKLDNNSQIQVSFSGGQVYLTRNGNTQAMGSNLTLKRHSGGSGYNALKIAQSLSSSSYYPGDLQFVYSGGTHYVVCHLYIEDYVYGVLPYEMDNSFPLEALKAQAVAARTYAIRAKTSSGVYDVTDTSTHQVFRGVNYQKTRCIQAVDETWGIVMSYDGSYIGAYYSASNGGQTESNKNFWGSKQLGYLQVQDDPYDLANAASVVKNYTVYSSSANGSSVSAYSMIQSALAAKYGGAASGYTISQVLDVYPHTPKYDNPSRLYTQMHFSVLYNGGSTGEVDIAIFPTLESALNLSINSADNEMYSVEQVNGGFKIQARRYGHGIGMSQRGAQQMGETGFSYAQILGFYYTGATRVRMNFSRSIASPLNGAAPQPSATPAPVEDAEGIISTARVSLSNPEDQLNLRASASSSAAIIGKIPHGSLVSVSAASGNWCKVTWDGKTGYVAAEYLAEDEDEKQDSSSAVISEAQVTLSSGTLNLRKEGRATATVLSAIPNGAVVSVLETGATWTRVRYNNLEGYVMSKYLSLKTAQNTPAPEQSTQQVKVSLANPSETLNLRMHPNTSASILARLNHGTVLSVVQRGSGWTQVSYNGQTGYVMNAYIADMNAQNEQPQPAPTTAPTAAPQTQNKKAEVSLRSGSLNLRSAPNTSSTVLAQIPNGSIVTVQETSGEWGRITYNAMGGYVKLSFLKMEAETEEVQPEEPQENAASGDGWVSLSDVNGTVNLRQQASMSGRILASVANGQKIVVIERGEEWTQVYYNGFLGYIASDYIRFASAEAEAPSQTPVTEETLGNSAMQEEEEFVAEGGEASAWVVTGDGGTVNLRADDSTDSKVLAHVPSGSKLKLLNIGSKKWYEVEYNGTRGYMSSDYLSLTDPSAANQQEETQVTLPTYDSVINEGRTELKSASATLNLRSAANDLASVTGTLKQHETVEVLAYADAQAQWIYVRSGSIEGYARREHFRLEKDLVRVTLSDAGSTLSLRSGAGSNTQVIGTLNHGTVLTLLSTSNGWANVRTMDGTVGYVSAQYISEL